MSTRSARRPLPALILLAALVVVAVIVWIRVAQRDSGDQASAGPTCSTSTASTALPAPSAVQVNVLNGNGTAGLAGTTMTALAADGFGQGAAPGNASSNVDGVGTIVAGPSGAAAAKLLSFYVPGATVSADSRTDASVTLTVGTGFTAIADPQAVAAAIQAAGLTQAAPPASGSPSTASTAPPATSGC